MRMDPQVKAKWLTALRSGVYVQGKSRLRTRENQYCCLGVLCDLAAKEGLGEWDVKQQAKLGYAPRFTDKGRTDFDETKLPKFVKEWAGLNATNPGVDNGLRFEFLAEINDSGNDFSYIADVIEAQL